MKFSKIYNSKIILTDSVKLLEKNNVTTDEGIIFTFLGEDNYKLVQIPPGLANGYKSFGDKLTILANCANLPHDPDEMIKIDPFKNDIPYDWGLKHG